MAKLLRILIIEDSEDDAQLILRQLRQGGYEPEWERVDTPEAMLGALDRKQWDAVISDYIMPHFSGLNALSLLQKQGQDLPFIVVSGKIGEDVAVEAMKAGAHDYLMKNNLHRLPVAVELAMKGAENRRALKKAEDMLKHQEEEYRALFENAGDAIFITDAETAIILDANKMAEKILGLPKQQIIGLNRSALHPQGEDYAGQFSRHVAAGLVTDDESVVINREGRHIPVRISAATLELNGRKVIQGIFRDISARKEAENELKSKNLELIAARNQVDTALQTSEKSRLALLSVLEDQKLAAEKLGQSEERYRTLVEAQRDLIIRWLPDTTLTYANQVYCDLTGKKPEEMLGRSWLLVLPAGDRVKFQEFYQELARNPEINEYEHQATAADGSRQWISWSEVPIFDKSGKLVEFQSVGRNITALKQAEALQRVLYQISDAAIGCRDLHQLYIQIHKTIAKLMPAENLYIALYDEKNGIISFPYYKDQKNDNTAPRRFGKGLTEHIITTQKPLLVNKQIHDQLQKEGKAEFVGQPSKQWLGVPLQAENRTFGTLVVQSYDEKAEYTQNDLELLNFVAGHVAAAILSIKAEQELAGSETRYRTFMDSATDIAFLKDDQLRYLMVNRAQEEFFGKPAGQILGKTDYDLLPNETAQAFRLSDQMALESKQTLLSHEQIGNRIYEARKFPVDLQNGKTGVGAYIRDITEQQRADQAIRESQEKYRDLVENINDVVFAVDLYGKLVYISPSSEPVLGYRPDEIIGRKLIEFVKEDDRTLLARELQKSLENGVADSEYRITTKKGNTRWISSSSRLMQEDGKPVGLNGLLTDITERKLAEEKLIQSEERYRALIETQRDMITRWLPDTSLTYVNQAYCDFMGKKPEEMLGKSWLDLTPEDSRKQFQEFYGELRLHPVNNEYEHRTLAPDGTPRWTAWSEVPIFDKSGRLLEYQSVGRDITGRKLAEEQIKLAAKKWETTFDSIGDGVCLLDRQWRILQCNQAFSKMVGKPYAEVLGCDCHELAHGPEHPRENCLLTKMERSLQRETMELEHEGKTLYLSADPIFDENKNLIGAVHIISDITGRKLMEQELLQAQKMEAVGFLAGGVAHDFNNMLAGIVGNAELLQLKIYGQKELEVYVDNIIKASGHAAGLTKQLLAFARKGQYQQVPVNVHKVIAETLGILSNTIDRRIKIEQHLRANPAVILGDHSQLENAFMNLGINARDAMPQGGKLIYSTDLVNLDKEYILQHNYKIEPGHYVQVSVEDTGSGMTDEVKRHLFEPFFTTKEKGRGTGLGLAGVYGCIKNHGGSVEVYSEPGRGTAVKLYLPLYADLADSGEPDFTRLQELPAAGTGSILIVDDEDMIRTIAAQILKTAGYRVQTCVDGQEAVELYARDHGSIDLVIMDMVMPKLDGREAFAKMQKINPKVKVLLSSGFSEDGDAQAILQDGAQGFIQKPYRSAELLMRVQQAMQPTKNIG
ncbi:PAS domain S-box protein [candidate division TA06 bacterium]|nr:PAS domain S-box protein [candidate division TA06 bacterium]